MIIFSIKCCKCIEFIKTPLYNHATYMYINGTYSVRAVTKTFNDVTLAPQRALKIQKFQVSELCLSRVISVSSPYL